MYTGKEKIPVVDKIPHTIHWELSYREDFACQGRLSARDLDSGEVRQVFSSDLCRELREERH